MATLKITQIKSTIGAKPVQRRTMKALGLRKIRHSVSHEDRPEIRGMLSRVRHLVEVEEVK